MIVVMVCTKIYFHSHMCRIHSHTKYIRMLCMNFRLFEWFGCFYWHFLIHIRWQLSRQTPFKQKPFRIFNWLHIKWMIIIMNSNGKAQSCLLVVPIGFLREEKKERARYTHSFGMIINFWQQQQPPVDWYANCVRVHSCARYFIDSLWPILTIVLNVRNNWILFAHFNLILVLCVCVFGNNCFHTYMYTHTFIRWSDGILLGSVIVHKENNSAVYLLCYTKHSLLCVCVYVPICVASMNVCSCVYVWLSIAILFKFRFSMKITLSK